MRVKSVMVIGLAVAQFLSWGAPAVHLCICSQGTVSIDSGPDNCRCSSEPASNQEQCGCHHETCADHATATRDGHSAGRVVASGRCDCIHIQLSCSQAPALSASLNFVDAVNSLAHDSPYFQNDSHGLASAGVLSKVQPHRQVPLQGWLLMVLSSVNLRC